MTCSCSRGPGPWWASRPARARRCIAGAADLLEVAERLLLDRGEPAGDIALGRLRLGKVVGLVRLDDLVLVGLPNLHPLRADLRVNRARLGEVLGAGDLRGLAEHAVDALRDQLVVHV